MKRNAFTKTAVLVKIKTGYGRKDSTEEITKNVKVSVSMIGLNAKIGALNAGENLDLTMTMYRRIFETDNYTHVDYDGKRYLIKTVTAGAKDSIVRLGLERCD